MNIIIISIIIALLFFVMQLALCYKAGKTAVKLIPLYILILPITLMIMDFAGLFIYDSVISAQGILAWVFAIFTAIALVGDGLAWAVYAIRKKTKKG